MTRPENLPRRGNAATAEALAVLERAAAELAPADLPEFMASLEQVRVVALIRAIGANGQGQPSEPDDRLLGVEAVAERLGHLSKSYVYELLRRNHIPSVTIGKHRFVRSSTLAQFIAAQESGRGLDARLRRLPNKEGERGTEKR